MDPTSFEIQSRVQDTKCFQNSHTAENLAQDMEETALKWGFTDPVSITDNAANIVLACELAKYPQICLFWSYFKPGCQ